ncbi:p-hydroxylaminobenzoate lyase [Pleurostoma richardsiae]|uniref:p-hydroxylaminobenzoate lyase n=1 Tax=Pleurostoma richardsiae TaxID=41990 RepID=A0AA38RHY1_9PEZI|nr:p-hydroxylaminobenzoate lyase [Pleurostoma richardsiae]
MASTSWLLRRRVARSSVPPSTEFFGSQIGGKTVINYSYTDFPWKLLAWDIYYFFHFAWALPYIVMPSKPTDSGDLDELALTRGNLFCVLVHTVLCILQLAFILCLPLSLFFPLWIVIPAIALFFGINHALCRLLNGKDIVFHSDARYARARKEHEHEQWIFLNGVAVGEHWMKNNLNRLALTFKRPVLGIHNRTSGIIFDVVECLIQRNFCYATSDVRVCYSKIKEKLYDPKFSKVIFILHSQGGIEGGLVLDWLLQELPQDLLAKLEVYTFGNAANHFNNPHRHVDSQVTALRHPLLASVDATRAPDFSSDGRPRRHRGENTHADRPWFSRANNQRPPTPTSPPPLSTAISRPLAAETMSPNPAEVSDRAIGHIEHYAHTTDFVALWGVLHFARSATATHTLPRFIGRLFARTSDRGGHQFCQHYLDGMFPLEKDSITGEFLGCAETNNEFMESEVALGKDGDEATDAREAFESSWLGDMTAEERRGEEDVEVHLGESPVATAGSGFTPVMRRRRRKVKELSRLWQYRNGKSPPTNGILRTATL